MTIPTKTLSALAVLALAAPAVAMAQEPIALRFSDSTTAEAPRSVALTDMFAERLGDDFEFQPYFSSTLIPQGSEIVAIQRGNLEMSLLPPSDFAKQVPAFDILGAAYVIRDPEHLQAVFASDVGDQFRQMARDEMGLEILGIAYYGARHVNLRGDREVMTPQDLNGVRLRMPGGESWQFLGSAIGANPTPMDYAEVYTGLQTGAIDGQDNPLPNNQLMKFHEVTDQIVLTGHNMGFGMLIINADLFASLTPEQQQTMRDAATEAFAWSDQQYIDQEAELVSFFQEEGLKVYEPDLEAFKAYAQEQYLASPLSQSWPEGMLERINAL
ncbi:sialic acid TRAP transporter substrate-binding protein SiaP [Pelagibacterium sp.]|uniref:sialic acid TRAP transporter substrate-binding protein SiaP n=1 Tax=Pelagibacterium sp. TaxID=1967288 RepID=UPI003BAC9AB9